MGRPSYRVVCVAKANGYTPADDGKTVVYVGRRVRFLEWTEHPLCNDKPPKRDAPDAERAANIARYRERLLVRPDLAERLDELRAATRNGELPLGCWCAPKACHADVLAELLAGEK